MTTKRPLPHAVAAFASMIGLVLLLLLPFAQPAGARDETSRLLDALIEELQLNEVAKSWQKGLTAPTSLPRCDCPPDQQARMDAAWMKAVSQRLDTEGFLRDLRSELTKRLSTDDLRHLVAFRRTPLGRRMKEAEARELAAGEDQAAFMAGVVEARAALEKDPARRAVISRLLDLAGGTKSLVDLTINIMIGTSIGAVAALPPGQPRPDIEALVRDTDNARGAMTSALEPIAIGLMGARFKGFSLAELAVVQREYEHPSGQKFVAATIDVMNEILRSHAIAIGRTFAQEWSAERL